MSAAPHPTLLACLALALLASSSAPTQTTPPARTDRFGDSLPPGAQARLGSVRFRPGGPLVLLRYTPDGKALLVCGQSPEGGLEHTFHLLGAAAGKERWRRSVDLEKAYPLRFLGQHRIVPPRWSLSRDGRLLALTANGGTYGAHALRVLDLAAGRVVFEVREDLSLFTFLQLSPDGKLLAATGYKQRKKDQIEEDLPAFLRVWAVASGKKACPLSVPAAFRPDLFLFSPDGRLLAAEGEEDGAAGVLRLWDLAGKRGSWRLDGQKQSTGAFAFSPDGKQLADVGGKRARLWDAVTGKQVIELGPFLDGCQALVFSPDGNRLAAVNAEHAYLWQVACGRAVSLSAVSPAVLLFAPDGRSLAVISKKGRIQLYEAITGKERWRVEGLVGTAGGSPVAFSPDSKVLAASTVLGTIRRWALPSGKELLPPGPNRAPALAVAFSPDGKTVAVAGLGGVSLWEAASARHLRTLTQVPGSGEEESADTIYPRTAVSLAYSPDGKHLAAGWWDGNVCAWGPATGARAWHRGSHKGSVRSLLFTDDGRHLLAGGEDAHIVWLDAASGKPVRDMTAPQELLKESGLPLPWDLGPGGRTAILNGFANLTPPLLFELASGKVRLSLDRYGPTRVQSPDGKLLAAHAGQTITLFDLTAGGKRLRDLPLTAFAQGVAFSPDGARLAATCVDGCVRIWQTTTGTLLGQHTVSPGGAWALAFSPDGQTLAVALGDTTVVLWDVSHLCPAAERVMVEAELVRLWDDLAAEDAARAGKALARLAQAPGVVAFVKERARRNPAGQRLAARAAQLLEAIGTPAAWAQLEVWARGAADDPLAREARAALMHRPLPALPTRPPARLDDLGDPLPAGALVRLGSLRFQHGMAVSTVRFLPGGKSLLTSFLTHLNDHTWYADLALWDADSGRRRSVAGAKVPLPGRRLDRDKQSLFEVRDPHLWCVSADGRLLAWVENLDSGLHRLHIQDVATGKVIHQAEAKSPDWTCFQFTPDGKALVAGCFGSEGALRVYDPATGKAMRRALLPPELAVVPVLLTVAPDSKHLAVQGAALQNGQRGVVFLWDRTGPRPPFRLAEPFLGSSPVAFSPDSKVLAVVSDLGGGEGRLRLWDADTGRALHDLGKHAAACHALVFSPDGKLLASLLRDKVRFWDAARGKELAVQQRRGGKALLFSPDGKVLALDDGVSVHLLDAASLRPLRELRYGRRSDGQAPRGADCLLEAELGLGLPIGFSPDGTVLAVADNTRARCWDVASGREIAPPETRRGAHVLAVSAGGRTVADGRLDEVILWDTAAARPRAHVKVEPGDGRSGPAVAGVAVAPDGKLLAVGGRDGSLSLWDAAGRKLHQLRAHQSAVTSLSFSADSHLLLSAGEDRRVCWWDTTAGRLLRQAVPPAGAKAGPEEAPAEGGTEAKERLPARAVALSPAGRLLAACDGDALRLWEPAGWHARAGVRAKYIHNLFHWAPWPARAGVTGALLPTFSLSGHYLAVATGSGVLLFSAADGAEVRYLAAPRSQAYLSGVSGPLFAFDTITDLAFSPDGKLLAAATAAGTFVWDVDSGSIRATLGGHRGPVLALAFSPDGTALVTSGRDTTLLVWDVASLLRQVSDPGPSVQDLSKLWRQLASADAGKAYAALCRLERHPKEAAALVGRQLRPAPPADAARLARLVADLASAHFPARQRAAAELEQLAELAEPALRTRLAGAPPLEVRRRVEQLLARLDGPVTRPEQLQALRAVELLERLGSAEARTMLRALAGGAPQARLTREARAALVRLDRRTAARSYLR